MEYMRFNLRDCVDEQFRSRKPHVTAARPVVFVLYLILSVLLAVSCTQSTLPDTSGEQVSPDADDANGGEIDDVTLAIPGVRIIRGVTGSSVVTHSSTQSGSVRASNVEFYTTEGTELWIVPTVRGYDSPIDHTNLRNVVVVEPLDDGTFVIGHENLPDSAFVIVVVNVSETEDHGSPIGILGLREDDSDLNAAILEFPSKNEIIDDIDFGEVVFFEGSDIGVSANTLTGHETSFHDDTLSEMRSSIDFANAIRMVLNLVRNHPDRAINDAFYADSASIGIRDFDPAQVIQTSNDIGFEKVELWVFSHDSETRAALYTPDQTTKFEEGYHNQGSDSSVKWLASVPMDAFREFAAPGALWPLVSESTGAVLARFDLSASVLSDQLGNPIVPLPYVEFEYANGDESKDVIERITFNWRYFLSDGETPRNLDDLPFLSSLVEDLWIGADVVLNEDGADPETSQVT